MACYFAAFGRMQALPCAYQWDVSYPMHARGQEHTRGCVRNPLGSGSLGSAFTCSVVADYVSEHCLWPNKSSSPQVHSVHFKGRQKPWMRVLPQCARVTRGALRTRHGGRVQLDHGEVVAWKAGACRLVRALPSGTASSGGESSRGVSMEGTAAMAPARWRLARQLAD